jgi:uncharacterized membrane protein YdbT with pleckstrin-like domain
MHLLAGETVLLNAKPARGVATVWFFTKAVPQAFLVTVLAFLPWMLFNSPPERGQPAPYSFATGIGVLASVFVVAAVVGYVYVLALARTYEYAVTDQRFLFSGGILRKVRHAVEHRRVTDVQLSENIVEQVVKLSSVSLFTPGTASVRPNAKNQPMPELRLEGLPNGEEVMAVVSECVRKARSGEP